MQLLRSIVWEYAQTGQMSLYIFLYLIYLTVRIDFLHLLLLLVKLYHRLRLTIKHLQPLHYRLLVVIRTTTCLASLQQPLLQLLLTTLKVQH